MTLARGVSFPSRNHTLVILVTPTPAEGMEDNALPFDVVRRAGIIQLIRLLRTHDVIYVAGQGFLLLLLARLLGKKVVVQHHGYQAVCPEGALVHAPDGAVCTNHFLEGRPGECVRCRMKSVGKLRGLLGVLLTYPGLWLCQRAAENVAVSEHVSKRLVVLTPRTIENGVRDETRTPPPRTAREIAPAPVFAFVGRLVREKGVDVLLRAAAELRDEDCTTMIRIIGDGPERNRLESLATNLEIDDSVDLTGYLEGLPLAEAMGHAAAIVTPSISEETSGLAAIEQLMRGRLVIASDIGGLGEAVGEAGLKFEAGKVGASARCMRMTVEDATLRMRLGIAARDRAVRLFTDERMIMEHLRLYRYMLNVSDDTAAPPRISGATGTVHRRSVWTRAAEASRVKDRSRPGGGSVSCFRSSTLRHYNEIVRIRGSGSRVALRQRFAGSVCAARASRSRHAR
jgi:glycosyltransferase involved in cell wall biosynthesis